MSSALIPLARNNTSTFQPSTEADQAAALGTKVEGPSVLGLAWSGAVIVGSGLAMALSYKRNQSIPWAFGSGLVWPAYLIYRAVDR